MNRRALAFMVAAGLLTTLIPSCKLVNSVTESVTGFFSSSDGGPGDVDELVDAVEQVYVETEVSREKAHAALVALQTMTAPDFDGDAVAAHADLVARVEASEEQAEELKDTIEEMTDSAEPVFEQWKENLESFTNPEMRKLSQKRLHETRKRYEEVLAVVEPALVGYETVNKSLRDYVLFLTADLNPTSLAAVRGDVKVVARSMANLDSEFHDCLVAARSYIDSAALPARAAARKQAEELEAEPVPVSGTDSSTATSAKPAAGTTRTRVRSTTTADAGEK